MTSASTTQSDIASMPSSSSSLHFFPSTLSIKLDDENFLVWEHQILATIYGLHFFHFLDATPAPPKFLTQSAAESSIINPAYVHHQQQDNLIVAWLLGSMSSPMLTKMVGLRTSTAIWKKLTIYFASQSRARVKKLKLQLKVSKKDRSISTYILDIKKTVDSLAAIGSPLSDAVILKPSLMGCRMITMGSLHPSSPAQNHTLLKK